MLSALPESFLQKMQECLGEEYEAFLLNMEERRRHALRVNTMKTTYEELSRLMDLSQVPWVRDGFFYEESDLPSRRPEYGAGLYYLQEPSAMTPASRLPIDQGDIVLDLCAAPGGKATALGTKLAGTGLLVANDINQARARALLRNLELFGLPNIFVTNEPPHILAGQFPGYFDKIMLDAPCSGEGMFRKNPAVIEAWKEKGPDYFSGIQKDIIIHAANMLKPGGIMCYSTCTFSPEENEAVITHLLRKNPRMKVIPMEDYEGFSPGITHYRSETFDESCALCRRIWPHRMPGEGHFIALLQNTDSPGMPHVSTKISSAKKKGKKKKASGPWWRQLRSITKEQQDILEDFFGPVRLAFDPSRIDVRGNRLYYVSGLLPDTVSLRFLRNGLYLGEWKKKRFEPSAPFALSLAKGIYPFEISLAPGDERLQAFLRGEDILTDPSSDKYEPVYGRWYLLESGGHPLGFGKLTKTALKNKLPQGWRRS